MSIGAVRAQVQGLALCAVLGIAAAVLGVRTWGLWTNTLEHNGRWEVTKLGAEIPILGAQSFFTGRQAMRGGFLDLGAWHGFQEVVYREALDLEVYEVDFLLLRGAYVVALFGGGEDGAFYGLRLSARALFPSALIRVDREGKFQRKEQLRLPPLEVGVEHHLRIDLRDGVTAWLDDRKIGSFAVALPPVQRVGLRGGRAHTFVDRVRLEGRGFEIGEEFERPPSTTPRSVVAGVVCAALPFGLVLVSGRRGSRAARRSLQVLATVELMALVVLAGAQPVATKLGTGYPERTEELARWEETLRRAELRRVEARTLQEYTVPRPPNVERIVFLGSSQTYGVGAHRLDDVWVARVEQQLNEHGHGGVAWQAVNAGVASARSDHLVDALSRSWLGFGAGALVINLGSNDRDENRFRRNVRQMVVAGRDAGASPVVVLEPNTRERGRSALARRHRALRTVASDERATLIDMQSYLDERYDDGFLWWDHVHLTSYGQRVMAQGVYEGLIEHGIVPPPERSVSALAEGAREGTRSLPGRPD